MEHPSSRKATYLRELTGLRGVASLWVVLFHFQYVLGFSPDLFDAVFANRIVEKGYLAVDFFFVLSGFVIARSAQSWDGSAPVQYFFRFIRARLARIYPMHFLTLTAMASLYVATNDGRLPLIPFLGHAGLIHAWGHFFSPDFNYPSWSISAEWAAYLAFPLIFQLNRRLKKHPAALLASAVVAGLALVQISSAYKNDSFDLTWDWGWARCLTEFWIGMCLYHWQDQNSEEPQRLSCFNKPWLPALVIAGICSFLIIPSAKDGWIVIVASLTVFSVGIGSPVWRRVLGNRVSHFLGEVSYSIYMLHIPLGTLALKAWADHFGPEQSVAMGTTALTMTFGLLIGASAITYRYIEVPARLFLAGRPSKV